jgi:hypothetical protein
MKKAIGKVLVFIIIGLFTGVSIVPSICGNITEVEYKKNFNESCKMCSARIISFFNNPIITYAIMCDWVDKNGSHGPAKTQFLIGQQVYFYAELENLSVGDVFYGEWWYNGYNIVFVSHSNPTNWSGRGYLSFSWRPPRAGIWIVKLYHGYYLGTGPEFTIINTPPNIPTITGTTNGKNKVIYDYVIKTTDPEENKVKYYIDWADGTHNMTDFYQSGEEISISHKWDTKGNYSVKVQAMDEYWATSDWATLTVTMPYSYNKPIPQFLERLFERFPNAFPIPRHMIGY